MTGPVPIGADGGPAVAVITGASRGLGAGMAATFASRGVRLGLCARTLPPAPDPGGALCAEVDVTDPAAVDCFADTVVSRLGRIDLWVNNAGVLGPIGPLADADPDAVRRNVEVNVTGVLFGSAAFARHVRSRPGLGTLVNVSSGAAERPYEGWAAYCGSKAAVDMITKVVGVEEGRHGLTAISLVPGVVDTEMQATIRATPAGRFPDVERFLRIAEDGAFNSPGWVADFVLDHCLVRPGAVGSAGDGVRRRVPDQHGAS